VTVPDIDIRLDELDAELRATMDDDDDFDDERAAVPRMDRATYEAFLATRAVTPYGQLLSRLRRLLVPGLLEAYRNASEGERTSILELFAVRRFVHNAIWRLVDQDAWRLQKAESCDRLALARQVLQLALLTDYLGEVEPGNTLTGVWSDLEAAGIDPRLVFLEAAALASDRPLSRGISARDVLRDFEPYDYGVPPRWP
jgi:hypothetical protein